MGAVATFLYIPISAAAMLVDVISGVALPSIVDEALLDGRRFPISRGWSLVDRHLPLDSGWLDVFFSGQPSSSRGRAFGLLSGRHVEPSLYLVSNAPRLGV